MTSEGYLPDSCIECCSCLLSMSSEEGRQLVTENSQARVSLEARYDREKLKAGVQVESLFME
jgi:hypothetical protein